MGGHGTHTCAQTSRLLSPPWRLSALVEQRAAMGDSRTLLVHVQQCATHALWHNGYPVALLHLALAPPHTTIGNTVRRLSMH